MSLYIWLQRITAALLLVSGVILVTHVGRGPTVREKLLASYATNVALRTPAQRRNARQAANALNDSVIPPGAVFSFNRTVGSWSADRGYVPAPVSYDGELVKAPGGGVCQTSTTVYNAALLAGMEIVQRHHHDYAPGYAPPGRDAAVAQYTIDLQFRNPYSFPVRVKCGVHGKRLVASFYGLRRPPYQIRVESSFLSVSRPLSITRVIVGTRGVGLHAYVRNPGATGYRVRTYRTYYLQGRVMKRQLLSDDTYGCMNRIVQVVEMPGDRSLLK